MLYPTELRDHAAAHIASRGRFAKRASAPTGRTPAAAKPGEAVRPACLSGGRAGCAYAASAVSASRTQ